MISQVAGTLIGKELDRVNVSTPGGVTYELLIPLGVYETLPATGQAVSLHTYLVVKEDGWQLFGFTSSFERTVFQRLLNAKGVGPSLAIGLLSALTAPRLVVALRQKDVLTLQSAPRVGRKKAEQLILDLADKLDDLQIPGSAREPKPVSAGTRADDAARALVSLGYSAADADRAVREMLDEQNGQEPALPELIRGALAKIRG